MGRQSDGGWLDEGVVEVVFVGCLEAGVRRVMRMMRAMTISVATSVVSRASVTVREMGMATHRMTVGGKSAVRREMRNVVRISNEMNVVNIKVKVRHVIRNGEMASRRMMIG